VRGSNSAQAPIESDHRGGARLDRRGEVQGIESANGRWKRQQQLLGAPMYRRRELHVTAGRRQLQRLTMEVAGLPPSQNASRVRLPSAEAISVSARSERITPLAPRSA